MKFSLAEMFKTGLFGVLSLGASRIDVLAHIGEPETWSVSRRSEKRDRAAVWKYGSLQIGFTNEGEATYYGLYLDENPVFPATLQIADDFPASNEPLEQFQKFLDKHKIDFEIDKKYPSDDTLCLLTKTHTYRISVYFAGKLHLTHIFLNSS